MFKDIRLGLWYIFLLNDAFIVTKGRSHWSNYRLKGELEVKETLQRYYSVFGKTMKRIEDNKVPWPASLRFVPLLCASLCWTRISYLVPQGNQPEMNPIKDLARGWTLCCLWQCKRSDVPRIQLVRLANTWIPWIYK